jgi:hypothetical protein
MGATALYRSSLSVAVQSCLQASAMWQTAEHLNNIGEKLFQMEISRSMN